ncbi:MAG: hypothetical protein ACQESN_11870 [Thermotogota bacterium]
MKTEQLLLEKDNAINELLIFTNRDYYDRIQEKSTAKRKYHLYEYLNEISFDSEVSESLSDYYRSNYPMMFAIMDRQYWVYKNYSTFDKEYVLQKILHNHIHFIEKIKPDFILFSEVPHEIVSYALYLLARYYNIKTVMLHSLPFIPNATLSVCSIHLINEIKTQIESNKTNTREVSRNIDLDKYKSNNYKDLVRKSFKVKMDEGIDSLLTKKALKNKYKLKNNLILELYKKIILKNWHKKIRKTYHALSSDYNLSQINYIYFPLHYQPEQTTLPLGFKWANQLSLIKRLVYYLPKDWKLLIKENPFQYKKRVPSNMYFRSAFFYEELRKIEKVKIVSLNTPQLDLIDFSKFIVTINGTTGWEAINRGKHVVCFGPSILGLFDGVTNLVNVESMSIYIQTRKYLEEIKFEKNREILEKIKAISLETPKTEFNYYYDSIKHYEYGEKHYALYKRYI